MDRLEFEISEINRISEEKIVWFRSRANTCMYLFWFFSVILGASSTSLPLFALLDNGDGKNWVVALLSVIVAFCSFMLQIGNYHMLWQNYRRSEFAMTRLQQRVLFQFRNLMSSDATSAEAVKSLLSRFHAEYEEIEITETNTYFSTLKSAKDISS